MQSARIFVGMLALGVGLHSGSGLSQPSEQDWETTRQLYPGIRLIQVEVIEPRRNQIRCIRIDLTTERLKLLTTERVENWIHDKAETQRETTRDFIRRSRQSDHPVVVAINANAFSPWPAPYNERSRCDLKGLAVADGVQVSPANGTPSLLVHESGKLQIDRSDQKTDVSDVQTAVSGMGLCLIDGKPLRSGADLHPRTGIGLSRDGRYLFFLTVDGRQPTSHGATTEELGTWLAQWGAYTGMNMDGGGSTTLAWWDPSIGRKDKCRLLNSPVGDGLKLDAAWGKYIFSPSERANGNNLGIYFEK